MPTNVLQIVLMGSTGFRLPFGHFATDTGSGHGPYLFMWQSVNMLLNVGFTLSTSAQMEHKQRFL